MDQSKPISRFKSLMNFYSRWRFTILLATMVLFNLFRMATLQFVEDRLIIDLFAALIFVVVTLSLCVRHRTRLLGLLLGTPAIVLLLFRNFVSEHSAVQFMMAARVSCALFLGFVIFVIIMTLLQQTPTSRDSIAGAFCGYLMIGVMFAEIYCLLEMTNPDSFKIESLQISWKDEALRNWLMLEYFSFVTLTTVGYGDVVPVTPTARFIAVWEAICGQFYMAVLVAGLVSLRTSDLSAETSDQDPDT